MTDSTPTSEGDPADPPMVQPLVDAIPDNSAEVAELPEKQAPQTDDHAKSASGCETSSHSEASSASKTSSASEAPNATKASSQSKASRKKSRNKVKVRKRTSAPNIAQVKTSFASRLWSGLVKSRCGNLVRNNPKPFTGVCFVLLALMAALCWPDSEADRLNVVVDDALLNLENVALSDLPDDTVLPGENSGGIEIKHPLAKSQPPELLIPDYGQGQPQFDQPTTNLESELASFPHQRNLVAQTASSTFDTTLPPIQTVDFRPSGQPAVWLTGSIEFALETHPSELIPPGPLPSVIPGVSSAKRYPPITLPRGLPHQSPISTRNSAGPDTVTAKY